MIVKKQASAERRECAPAAEDEDVSFEHSLREQLHEIRYEVHQQHSLERFARRRREVRAREGGGVTLAGRGRVAECRAARAAHKASATTTIAAQAYLRAREGGRDDVRDWLDDVREGFLTTRYNTRPLRGSAEGRRFFCAERA